MIVLKDISKSLQGRRILNNISFHISENETVGIIGRNGAGKTTLLRVIAGLLEVEEGFFRVGETEFLIADRQMLQNVAFVSGEKHQLWEDIRVCDSLELCIKMYGVSKRMAEKRFKELDEVFEVRTLLDEIPQTLSVGERMRCELVYALLAAPKLLLLDEAMLGLDVSMKYRIMEYLEQIKKKQEMTILYTSHNFGEIENLCDRILLLDEGGIIFDGSVQQMLKEFAPLYQMEVLVEDGVLDFEDLPLEKFVITNNHVQIFYDKQKIETAQILEHVLAQTCVLDVRVLEPNLEETIKKIYTYQDKILLKNKAEL